MNEVQIFNSPEFGDVRTVVLQGEPWFVAKDVSEPLGYTKTSNMTKLIDDDDRQVISSSILEQQVGNTEYAQVYRIGIINESGLYAAIFGSKLPNAKKFKKWVTSEVLPSIRKTGEYKAPKTTKGQIQLLAQGYMEMEKKVDGVINDVENVKSDLESLKMDLPILPIEADRITEAVKRKGVSVLGGKHSNAYQNRGLRQKLYNSLYANLKYNFGVKSYKSIKRSQCDKAIEIINAYQPPVFIAEQIEYENAQMGFRE